jgi:hypothetical protein
MVKKSRSKMVGKKRNKSYNRNRHTKDVKDD